MEEYIEIRLDIFDRQGQRAQVLKTLRLGELIEEILKEFDDIPADSPERYALYLKGSKKSLPREQTLEKADIQPQDELTLAYANRDDLREMLDAGRIKLRDEETDREYALDWTPALIGRPTNSAEHNMLLAVNFQNHPNGMSISRRHAQISMKDGKYYLESLTPTNPTILNKKVLAPGQKAELRHKDTLFFGKNVKMTFLMQPTVEDAQQHLHPASFLETQSGKSEPVFGSLTSGRQDENVTMMGEALPGLHLFIEKAAAASGTLTIDTFPAILGRSHPLLLGEKEVSRQHVEFRYNPDLKQAQVIDLNSANGSFLNGTRLTPQAPYVINSGMRLQLGPNVILVVR